MGTTSRAHMQQRPDLKIYVQRGWNNRKIKACLNIASDVDAGTLQTQYDSTPLPSSLQGFHHGLRLGVEACCQRVSRELSVYLGERTQLGLQEGQFSKPATPTNRRPWVVARPRYIVGGRPIAKCRDLDWAHCRQKRARALWGSKNGMHFCAM